MRSKVECWKIFGRAFFKQYDVRVPDTFILCWDIISIMVAIMSTAIVIYFGEWIKSILPINLIALLLLVHVVYIGIICYVKDWLEK